MDIKCEKCGATGDQPHSPSCKSISPIADCKLKIEPLKRGEKLFKDASSNINGARQTTYGNPEDSFQMIAERWNQFLKCRYGFDHELTAEDIAFMLADFKMARECNQHKRDNLVDASGYLGIADDLVTVERQLSKKELEGEFEKIFGC